METGSTELITHLQNLLIVTYGNQVTHAWLTFLATRRQAKLKLTQFQHPANMPTVEISEDFKAKAARLFSLSGMHSTIWTMSMLGVMFQTTGLKMNLSSRSLSRFESVLKFLHQYPPIK